MVIYPSKIQILIIFVDASLQPICKGHNLLFILASFQCFKSTVHCTYAVQDLSLTAVNYDYPVCIPLSREVHVLNLVRVTMYENERKRAVDPTPRPRSS
jgi:hypothetical protein